jgi:hypothetical protein
MILAFNIVRFYFAYRAYKDMDNNFMMYAKVRVFTCAL